MSNEPANIQRHLDAIAFSTDGGLILSASSLTNRTWSGSLWYFDEPDAAPDIERVKAGAEADSSISDMAVIPHNRIVTASDSGAVSLWHLTDQNHTLQCTVQTIEHDAIVTSVSATADNNTVISASHDCSVKIWDLEKFVTTHTYKAHYDNVRCVSCHPTDTSLFISASQDGRLLLWDRRQSKPATFIDTSVLPSSPTCVLWHPEEEHCIVVGTETGQLVIQDVRKSVITPVIIHAHSRSVTKLKFAPHKPTWVASCSEDCRVSVTDVSAGRVIFRDDYHDDFVTGIDWEPKSDRLFSCGWDTNVGGRQVTMEALSSPLSTLGISEKQNIMKESPEKMDDSPQCNGFIAENTANCHVVEAKN